MDVTFLIFLMIFFTYWGAYLSAAETSLFSLPSTRIKAYESDANPRRQLVARLLKHPRDLLVTIFMLNTLVNILFQNIASSMFGDDASWTLKVGFPLAVTLFIGEIVPKYIGLQHNVAISDSVAPLINYFQNLIQPIRQAVIAVAYPISRVLFFFLKKEENISREELKHVLKTSEELEVLHSEESELVCGYLDLQDVLVKELMRPRQDVLFYDLQEPLTKLTHLFVDQQCSRVPVCRGSLEQVVGIMDAKDFFIYHSEFNSSDKLIVRLQKPYFIPENTLARVLLRRFDETKRVIAIVVDEYGSISGLITREDILEVVVGQIEDLRDTKSVYSRQSETEIIASGKMEIDELNDVLHVDLQSENNMVTIGGWLTEQLGEIPKSGTKFTAEGLLFHVLAAAHNRVRRVYIRNLKPKQDLKK